MALVCRLTWQSIVLTLSTPMVASACGMRSFLPDKSMRRPTSCLKLAAEAASPRVADEHNDWSGLKVYYSKIFFAFF